MHEANNARVERHPAFHLLSEDTGANTAKVDNRIRRNNNTEIKRTQIKQIK